MIHFFKNIPSHDNSASWVCPECVKSNEAMKTKQSWAATPGNAPTDGECMPLGPKKCVLTMTSYATVCRFAGRTKDYLTKKWVLTMAHSS